MTETTEDWCQPGATVYEYSPASGMGMGYISEAVVERLTKTQVVLTNGRRYRRPNLVEVGASIYRGRKIIADNDPLVGKIRRSQEEASLRNDAVCRCEEWSRRNRTVESARAAVSALEAWIAHQEAGQ